MLLCMRNRAAVICPERSALYAAGAAAGSMAACSRRATLCVRFLLQYLLPLSLLPLRLLPMSLLPLSRQDPPYCRRNKGNRTSCLTAGRFLHFYRIRRKGSTRSSMFRRLRGPVFISGCAINVIRSSASRQWGSALRLVKADACFHRKIVREEVKC